MRSAKSMRANDANFRVELRPMKPISSVTFVTLTSFGSPPCNRIALPPQIIFYGKPDLLPDCAVEPDFWSGRTHLARQADAGIRSTDVPLAREPSSDPHSRLRGDRWLLVSSWQDFRRLALTPASEVLQPDWLSRQQHPAREIANSRFERALQAAPPSSTKSVRL